MKTFIPFIVVLLIIGACTNEVDPIIEPPEIHGEWSITTVMKDNQIQRDWENKVMVFEDLAGSKGTYTFSSSPDETIWKTAGEWEFKISDKRTLVVDDNLEIEFMVTSDNLTMNFVTFEDEECPTPPCVPVVTGEWHFKLTRI
jgi:hypothetical protein